MKIPKFLQQLMSSPEYMDKNSKVYAMADKYLKMLYPGTVQTDATGRMTEPEYDMTLTQFDEAQRQIDADFEEAKNEAEEEILEEYGEYFENLGIGFDIDACVIPGENIPVKVLYDDDVILMRHLETYDLDIPNFEKVRKIWRWHSEEGDNTCDECASRDGEIYDSEEDIPSTPVHPNCRCSVTEDVIGLDGRTLSSKPYKPKTRLNNNETQKGTKEMPKDEKFEEAYNKLKEPEGKYTDGKSQVRDEPTNMGIKQSTLDDYAKKHPEKDLPSDVKYLQPDQAKEIYKDRYWNNTEIPQIENDRVRHAVFDMNVMGGAGRVVQRALNDFSNAGLSVDGKIGPKTVEALNSIPANKVSDFMETLKAERFEYLRKTDNWPTAKNGWTKRTNKY